MRSVAAIGGRRPRVLASLGHRVSSVDLSPVGVRKARETARRHSVEIDAQVGDLEHFDLGLRRWDLVVSIYYHLPSSVRRDVHRRVIDCLRPGVRFLLEAYDVANIGRGVGGPQSNDMTIESAELENQFRGWTISVSRTIERDITESTYHNGLSSTKQFLAAKSS